MAVAGDLADFGLSDLLYMIKVRGLTGRLTVRRGDDDAVLYFTHGRLSRVSSSRVSQRLGELLVYSGRLTKEQLAETLRAQATSAPGEPLGALLVRQGLVTSDNLEEALRYQAEEVLLRVLGWQDGAFAYCADEASSRALPLPEINLERMILEAVRLADEWEAVRDRIPSLDYQVAPRSGQEPVAPTLRESIVLASVARGATTLRAVAEETRLAEPDLLRIADDLARREALTISAPAGRARAHGPWGVHLTALKRVLRLIA